MVDQAPALTLLAPFFMAFVVSLFGQKRVALSYGLVIGALSLSCLSALFTLLKVAAEGEVVYLLGGWPRPFGIEFRVDSINALVLLIVAAASLVTGIYSRQVVEKDTAGKEAHYYTLFLLLVTGLLGITLTGDAFNLFVLMEVSSLTTYALIAMGSGRAVFSAYKYLIMGTLGASFYLLGVGYLYIKTGTLNMVDIQQVIANGDLYSSRSILVAFSLMVVGVWVKMAFFPLHGWLPDAYSFAPTATGCLLAPLVTKVTVYVMIRMILTVFGPQYTFGYLDWNEIVVWLAVIAIVAGSIAALGQTDLRKMLSYIIVAEVGYMVGGVWLANEAGLVGAVYHIVSDAFMTLCLFLAVGAMAWKTRSTQLDSLRGAFKSMPLTMAAFVVGGLSIVGVPPTCGFFSKWYLIRGGIEAAQWEYVAALLFSSLINAILFFRVIEIAYFPKNEARDSSETDSDHPFEPRRSRSSEAPPMMLVPLLGTAIALVVIGLYNSSIVNFILDSVQQFGLAGGMI